MKWTLGVIKWCWSSHVLLVVLTACHPSESRHPAFHTESPMRSHSEQTPVLEVAYHSRMIRNLGSIRVYLDGAIYDERLGKRLVGNLTKLQFAELMGKLNESGFFALSAENMRAQLIREDPTATSVEYFGTPHLIDGTAVRLSVKSPGGTNTVSWYGLDLAVKQYPHIKDFEILSNCIQAVEEAAVSMNSAR
jgi:hypothetical protein